MNILITGASGFLGKTIYSNFPAADTLGRNSDNIIIADLSSDIPSLHKKYDLVIHCAGLAHKTPIDRFEEELFYRVNHNGTLNLLRGLENGHLPESFLFISTVAVYGKNCGRNINENSVVNPDTPYAKSKVLAEIDTLKWGKENSVKVSILRLPLIVGANPPGNLGLMINGILNGYYFNIAGGNAKKSMVLASDVALIIDKASKISGVYNLTDGYHPSFSELSALIAIQLKKRRPSSIPLWIAGFAAKLGDVLGKKAPINSEKLRKITSDLTFDDSKAREVLGWDPTPVLEGFKVQ